MWKKFCVVVTLILLSTNLWAENVDFAKVTLDLNPDGSALVTERVVISGVGHDIHHGLLRDIPCRRRIADGRLVDIGISVVDVKIDDQQVPYELRNEYDGYLTVKVGSKDQALSAGTHTFEFCYKVQRALVEFDDFPELTWQVWGGEWDWSLDGMQLSIHWPAGVDPRAYRLWVGEKDASSLIRNTGDLHSLMLPGLFPRQKMTVALQFNPGFFNLQKPWIERIPPLWIFLGWLTLMVAVVLFFNFKVVKGHKVGVVIPLFEPPKGVSPAAAQSLRRRNGATGLGLDLMALAAQGAIKLTVSDGEYFLTQGDGDVDPQYEDLVSIHKQLGLSQEPTNLEDLKEDLLDCRSIVVDQQELFVRKSYKFFVFWKFLLAFLLFGSAVLLFLFLLDGWEFAYAPFGAALILFIPSSFRKAYTAVGAQLKQQLDGLKLYITMAEKDRLNLLNPPELTPQHFEKLMPYAKALGVDQAWTDAFTAELARQNIDPETVRDLNMGSWMLLPSMYNDFVSQVGTISTPHGKSGFGSQGSSFGGGGFSGSSFGGGGARGW